MKVPYWPKEADNSKTYSGCFYCGSLDLLILAWCAAKRFDCLLTCQCKPGWNQYVSNFGIWACRAFNCVWMHLLRHQYEFFKVYWVHRSTFSWHKTGLWQGWVRNPFWSGVLVLPTEIWQCFFCTEKVVHYICWLQGNIKSNKLVGKCITVLDIRKNWKGNLNLTIY